MEQEYLIAIFDHKLQEYDRLEIQDILQQMIIQLEMIAKKLYLIVEHALKLPEPAKTEI